MRIMFVISKKRNKTWIGIRVQLKKWNKKVLKMKCQNSKNRIDMSLMTKWNKNWESVKEARKASSVTLQTTLLKWRSPWPQISHKRRSNSFKYNHKISPITPPPPTKNPQKGQAENKPISNQSKNHGSHRARQIAAMENSWYRY